MLEDWLVFAALLASLIGFGWAMNHVAVLILSTVPVDPTCVSPADCVRVFAGTL